MRSSTVLSGMAVFAFFICFSPIASAAVLHVPAQYPTIQAGIDSAVNGDTILVANGTFTGDGNRDMDFLGKAITVISENGPDHCVIDCQGSPDEPHRAFRFHMDEGHDSVLEGFTIRGGFSDDRGSAIWCSSSPTIRNNWIVHNETVGGFGAFYCEQAAPVLEDNIVAFNLGDGIGVLCEGEPTITGNIIYDNSSAGIRCSATGPLTLISNNLILENQWTGIKIDDAELSIRDNRIIGNRRSGIDADDAVMLVENCLIIGNSGSKGAGIHCDGRCSIINCQVTGNTSEDYGGGIGFDYAYIDGPSITGCTIAGNSAVEGGGGLYTGDCEPFVTNTIISGNSAIRGPEIYVGSAYSGSGDLWIRWSDVEGGKDEIYITSGGYLWWGDGMISADPLFAAGPLGGYYLSQTLAGQPVDSPCLDSGDPQSTIPIGTTRTDGVQDSGVADMGWHYPLTNWPQIGIDPLRFRFEETFPYDNLDDQLLAIRSLDSSLLEWSVSCDADWLTISPSSGSSTGETDLVTIGIDPGPLRPGRYVTLVTATGAGAGSSLQRIPVLLSLASPPYPWIVVGPGPGEENPPNVRCFPATADADHDLEFTAYGTPKFGVNVAAGDVNGDGKTDFITGPGPGMVFGPHVRGFGVDGSFLPKLSFLAYGTLKWGINVAVGQLTGDESLEIITGAGPGAIFGPHVRGFSYDGSAVSPLPGVSYFAYGALKWGVNVTAGDIDGDGFDEIVTGAGPGPVFGAHVRGWDMDGGSAAAIPEISFLAYGTRRFGVEVACGDVDGDGIDEILTAPGPSPFFGAHIRGWNYDNTSITPLPGLSFFPWSPDTHRYGARVWVDTDLDEDGRSEIVIAPGPDPTADTTVKVFAYDGANVSLRFSFEAFPGLTHGANVSAGRF